MVGRGMGVCWRLLWVEEGGPVVCSKGVPCWSIQGRALECTWASCAGGSMGDDGDAMLIVLLMLPCRL